MPWRVVAVCRSSDHGFSKPAVDSIELQAGHGVVGDTHSGAAVKHRSRVARDPTQPNLRQVHLLHEEMLAHLQRAGFALAPGAIGENVTTRGIDLLALPRGTRLALRPAALVEVSGLRNPCHQLDGFQRGLMAALLERGADGRLIRKAGVMAVVVAGGVVRTGDRIDVGLPGAPHHALQPV
ncbi:MAG: MOSC domain-containing protein [Burkholderiaceae bacterium]|nr:MOSC domain-containing protein [Burkholderiaceae bacterium]